MKRTALPVLAALAAPAVVFAGAMAASAQPSPTAVAHSMRTCAKPATGNAACHALVRVDASGKPLVTTAPSGFGPADIQSAYGLTGATSTATVAIVDAYDDPTAEADLGVYRAQFGLPPCTTANGCFRKVGQTGSATSLPRPNAGWATEISLDLDMVSATCPTCKILLVEASSTSFGNLGAAVSYAATQGVAAISNSYGGTDVGELAAYDHPGIAITASTGDAGYGIEAPASFGTVIAVGGTSLKKAANARGWSETAWSGAGSGCSTKNARPAWQTSATQCSGKANADVSAIADPNTGVAIYDSTSYRGGKGWQVYGGTSAAAPIIAGVYALGGNLAGYPAAYTWGHGAGLNDVVSGSNGTCTTAVWCTSGSGWDGPTGLGTPAGLAAF